MIKQTPSAFIPDDYDPDLDALEQLSNSVVDLIRQRRFDEAVKACVELKRRYPDQMDWIFRTAEVRRDRSTEISQAAVMAWRCSGPAE